MLQFSGICFEKTNFCLLKQGRSLWGGVGVRPPNNCFRTKKVHLIWSYVADLYHIQILQKKWITANKKCF